MVNNYNQMLQLQDIAEHAGVSPFYLERLFKQETAENPRSYLETIRVDMAAHLPISKDKNNLDICFETGFQSPSNFTRYFAV